MRMKIAFLTTLVCLGLNFNAQQLPNSGFENWDSFSVFNGFKEDRATDWNTVNASMPIDVGIPKTCFQSTDFHSGSNSVHLLTVAYGGAPSGVVNGIATTGTVNTTTQEIDGGIAFTARPDSLTGWYKTNPQSGDYATIEFVLKSATNDTIGWARFEGATSPVSTWTRFAVPVQYFSGDTPDLAVSLLSSSFGFSAIAGSELWVDDLELIYNPAGVDEIDNLTSVFYANNRLSWKGEHNFTSISINNLNGQLIIDHQNLNDNSLDLMLKKGLYLINLRSDEGVFTKKLSVR